ncbi:hypothetical protein Bpfe_011082 [Biomphalaria pfeifferi]|uniref:Uncharacterized protein n=1 Tax=Biomphalaria pfeifferi TaxID=112525 RepID=A0AAD8BRT3_BIOPF|nr:hypothetical protein Bpfe_011082 [Biomphalaria pfeifferi]
MAAQFETNITSGTLFYCLLGNMLTSPGGEEFLWRSNFISSIYHPCITKFLFTCRLEPLQEVSVYLRNCRHLSTVTLMTYGMANSLMSRFQVYCLTFGKTTDVTSLDEKKAGDTCFN